MSEGQFGQLIGSLFILAGPLVVLIVFLVRARTWRTAPGGGNTPKAASSPDGRV